MTDKQNPPGGERDTFRYAGPQISGSGPIYRVTSQVKNKNAYKNEYNTDVARERGLVPESEDDGDIE